MSIDVYWVYYLFPIGCGQYTFKFDNGSLTFLSFLDPLPTNKLFDNESSLWYGSYELKYKSCEIHVDNIRKPKKTDINNAHMSHYLSISCQLLWTYL
jgi:hypothetical protein